MSLATLFGKLQEHEMELQRLNQNEETDKKKRSIALKASSSMQEENEEDESKDEEDFSLFVKKFQKFIKKRRIERRKNFNNGRRSQEDSQVLRCNKCNQLGHIKSNCPSNEEWPKKSDKKRYHERRTKKAYIAWCRNLPFCRQARRGSRVRLPKEENARSRHQRLFVENVGKTKENWS